MKELEDIIFNRIKDEPGDKKTIMNCDVKMLIVEIWHLKNEMKKLEGKGASNGQGN